MKPILFLFLFYFYVGISSAQKILTPVSVSDNIPTHKLRVDPNYAYGGRASQIFDTVIYTPLETRKDVVVGFTQNLQISKHYFVFFDQDLHGLYIFGRDGKYISSIKKLPLTNWNPQGDGYSLYHFYLDKQSEKIYIIYNDKTKENNKFLAVFSGNGELLKNTKLPALVKDMSISFLNIDSLGNRSSIITHYNNPKEHSDSSLNHYHFYKIENFDSISKRIFANENTKTVFNASWVHNYNPGTNNNGNIIWSRNFDYMLLHSNPKGEIEKLQILLPLSMSIDSSFYKDTSILSSFDKSFAYFNNKNKVVSQIMSGVITDNNWLIFQLQNNTFPTPMLLYHLSKNKLLDLNKISSDSMSYFLPIKSWRIESVSDNSIFNIIPAYELFSVKSGRDDQPWDRNPVLKEYFEKQNRKSNPVIVELKLKSNL